MTKSRELAIIDKLMDKTWNWLIAGGIFFSIEMCCGILLIIDKIPLVAWVASWLPVIFCFAHWWGLSKSLDVIFKSEQGEE